jgi:prepilin signal peptidase PulO-like enzyme (type II secretory pathway)
MANILLIITLIFLAAYDIKTRTLPNVVMFPLIALACLVNGTWPYALLGAVMGAFIYLHEPFEQHIAEGDVKLAALLGAIFGFIGIIGMIGGVVLVAVIRFLTRERGPMAFAPFATLATLLCLLSDKVISAIVR